MKAVLVQIYGEAGARTDNEIKTMKNDTTAVAAPLPTVGAKASAKKTVEDTINALPANATEANLAAVEAAWKALKEYQDIGGKIDAKLSTKLNDAKDLVKTDMLKNLTIAYDQLDNNNKVAVKELKEKIETAVELAKKDNLFGNGIGNDSTFKTIITTTLGNVRDAELASVIKAINAIQLNVTLSDQAVVIAARAAYYAFVEDWTDYAFPYDAAK